MAMEGGHFGLITDGYVTDRTTHSKNVSDSENWNSRVFDMQSAILSSLKIALRITGCGKGEGFKATEHQRGVTVE